MWISLGQVVILIFNASNLPVTSGRIKLISPLQQLVSTAFTRKRLRMLEAAAFGLLADDRCPACSFVCGPNCRSWICRLRRIRC